MRTHCVSAALIAFLALSACAPPSIDTPVLPTQTVPEAVGVETLSTDPTLSPSGTTETPSIGAVDAGRASSLYHFQVYDPQSQALGASHDLLLNFDTNSVEYVMVSVDGGSQLVAVPWSAMVLNTSAAAQNQNSFVYGGNAGQLASAGAFDVSSLPPFGQSAAGWDMELRGYWGQSGEQGAQATSTPGTQTVTELQGVVLASDFIGRSVVTVDEQSAGIVEDLVIDANTGHIRYIVINTSRGGDPGLILVPVYAFAWNAATGALFLIVEQTVFIAAPFYTIETFPDTQEPDWDEEVRTYWQAAIP